MKVTSAGGAGWQLRDEKPQYRMVSCAIWRTRLRGLSPCALAVHYLLTTGPNTTSIPGVLSVGERELAGQLCLELDAFRLAFEELAKRDLVEADWDAGLVWVKHTAGEDPPNGPNTVKRWRTIVRTELPDCAFIRRAMLGVYRAVLNALASPQGFAAIFAECFPELLQPIGEPIPVPFREPFPEPMGDPGSLIPDPKLLKSVAGAGAPAARSPEHPTPQVAPALESRKPGETSDPGLALPVQRNAILVPASGPPSHRQAKERREANPRHRPLLEALVAVYEAKFGRYALSREKDLPAVSRLLELAEDPEVLRRWVVALVHPRDFLRVRSIAEFSSKWNHYAELRSGGESSDAGPCCEVPGCDRGEVADRWGRQLCMAHTGPWLAFCEAKGFAWDALPGAAEWNAWAAGERVPSAAIAS